MQFDVRSFSARYPAQENWALREVNLTILPGEITWIAGALGSGTSTLLLALAGLIPRLTGGESQGEVTLDQRDVALRSPLEQGIAYLGPSPTLQISGIARTVQDEVGVGPMNLGRPRSEITASVGRAMELLEIGHLAGRAPGALSGGETQRMLLAALLAAAPRVWLLDEPFSALDHASTARVQRLIRDMAREGATVVVACDDADAMLGLADRMIVLDRGAVVLDGNPSPLLAGDPILASGASTTDAASLAATAGFPAPRPTIRQELEDQVDRQPFRLLAAGGDAEPVALAIEPAPSSLAFEQVAFGYGNSHRAVLDDVTFSLRGGEGVGLFGANGAGKSTILRLAMALERPRSGQIQTLGERTTGRNPEDFAPQVGFLFQQPERQLFAASVGAECALAPRLAGWDAARIADSVATVLNQLGLADTAEEHPYDLPLPRRRLVALAAVLTAEPQLILLDEPTAGLDATSRDRVIRVVQEQVALGRGVLAITHDPFFAHEALGRGLILEGGRIVHDGPVRDVIDDRRMVRPAALAIAISHGLPPGRDRRLEVIRAIARH